MRAFLKRSNYVSFVGMIAASLSLASCSAPDRLTNDDIDVNATKDIVRERLISPVEDERIVEFNKKLPRRSILQVIHSPQSLSDPTFLQLIEDQLSEEINFRQLQDDLAGDVPLPEIEPEPLSEEEKENIKQRRSKERGELMYAAAADLEEQLFLRLDEMEQEVETLFFDTVPLLRNETSFPPVIGLNLTEDPNGYLSFPADVVLIGGDGSTFTSKTADLKNYVDDKQISLSVRNIPLSEALGIVASALNIEYTMSEDLVNQDRAVSISLRSNALAILDALLTQNELAIMYDGALEIARFYRDQELEDIDSDMKAAIRGHNELLFAKKKLERAETDVVKIKSMIDISQQLLSADYDAFDAGIKGFPRRSMGPIARQALQTLTAENEVLSRDLEDFDTKTVAMMDPARQTIGNGIRQPASGLSLSDMLVENNCIAKGQEIFVEKVAVYNVNGSDAVTHLTSYFDANALTEAETTPQQTDAQDGDADADADGGDEIAPPPTQEDADENAETAQATTTNSACPEYQISFQEDSTGLIIKGRRSDNSLAVRLVEELDVPKLQVLVEIFMITVSRDFNRQISNLITAAAGAAGGNGVAEAALIPSRAANVTNTADENFLINSNVLRNLSSAVAGGYSVRLNSPKVDANGDSLISSALSFLERNQLGRVLSSPTILVEHGTDEAFIDRTQSALVEFITPGTTTTDEDGVETTTPATSEIETYEAPFRLTLSDVKVFPANRTVSMDVNIQSTRFLLPNIEQIANREDADFIRDEISTAFTASPGDVIVLAGLSANSEGSTTAGLPGTTGALAPVSPLVGGSDQITNNVNEMIIFMAPTVIDPSSDYQPHSAIGKSRPLATAPVATNDGTDDEEVTEEE